MKSYSLLSLGGSFIHIICMYDKDILCSYKDFFFEEKDVKHNHAESSKVVGCHYIKTHTMFLKLNKKMNKKIKNQFHDDKTGLFLVY